MGLREYLKLLRLHQRAGFWLLLWPLLWALWLAAGGLPPLDVLAIFLVGTLLLRSANYAATPLALNPQVRAARTRFGIGTWGALLLFAALGAAGLVLVGKLNRLALWLFLPAVVLAAGNALTGRFYGLSRSHLGLVFCSGIPMAYAAVTNELPWLQVGLLMGASICWVLAYNTYSVAGAPVNPVYGTARELPEKAGQRERQEAGLLQALALLLLAAVGITAQRGVVFSLGLLVAAGHALYQQRLTRSGDRPAYIKAFLNNQRFGAAIFLGLALDYALTGWLATLNALDPEPQHDAMLGLHACTGPLPASAARQASVHDYGYCVDRNIVYTPPSWPQPMQLDLYAPQREGLHPGIVLLHGGHWRLGDRQLMGSVAVTLARRGYVAITITYRLAPASRFPAQLEDAEQAARWLNDNAARLHVDPERIGAWGFSAGAHLATMMATLDPGDPWGLAAPRLRAVVAGGTPTDLEHFNPIDGMALFGVTAQQDPALYRRASPLYHVSAKAPPIFLYHGSIDTVVPLQQAEVLRDALANAGAPVTLDIVYGVDHAGSTEGAMDAALGFLDQRLKP
jgi:acetyl esterase/lipase/4-hydroxybenzoate polyprenyltransferase